MVSKSSLAIALSRLKAFAKPKVSLEQYPTDSEIAAELLWQAYMAGDIKGRKIADLGCGTGILGIGCLLLGADHVYFADIDPEALEICLENLKNTESEYNLNISSRFTLIRGDLCLFDEDIDIVIENPPFGVKNKGADKAFLEKAFMTAPVIYSIHKPESKAFIEALSKEYGFKVSSYYERIMPLKQSYKFHKKGYRAD